MDNGAKPYNRKAVWSWCLFDFANSPFNTLVVTFIYSTFYTQSMAGNDIEGTALWSRGVTATAIIVALLSPIVGAIADRSGYRKILMGAMTAVASLFTIVLYYFEPGAAIPALLCFLVANIAFEMACVLYNAYLPDIAPPDKIGRISGYGWALGYAGGLAAMFIALVGFIQPEQPWFGFSRDMETFEHVRATNWLVAVWFVVFAIPLFVWVKERRPMRLPDGKGVIVSGFKQLAGTFREIRRYRQIVRLLAARLFYNDGLITIFAFAGIYAAGTLEFTTSEIVTLGIGLNVAAGLGAFAMGFMDDIVGGKRTIFVSLFGLSLAVVLAMTATNKAMFWVAGLVAGIFSGPNQAASRSLMGRFVPLEKENEFYGFFAFSGKATAFMGPFLFGLMTELTGTQRAGVACVLGFFLIGGVLLASVDEDEGKRLADRNRAPA